MGEAPQWYLLLRAARYLRVAPWDLARQPVAWMRWALAAESAEANERTRREKRKG